LLCVLRDEQLFLPIGIGRFYAGSPLQSIRQSDEKNRLVVSSARRPARASAPSLHSAQRFMRAMCATDSLSEHVEVGLALDEREEALPEGGGGMVGVKKG
jgi:hypothetical protein